MYEPPAETGILRVSIRRELPPPPSPVPVDDAPEEHVAGASDGTSSGGEDDDAVHGAFADVPGRTSAPRRVHRGGLGHFLSPERLEECQHAIGYHFRDLRFLQTALTHSSIKDEAHPSYERLEFLGDSVVGLVIAENLYKRLPDCDEGELTRVKSLVVSTDGLANAARAVGLDRYLALGRGILMKNEIPRSLIADVFEAVVGAVYMDRGFHAAELHVLDHLAPFIERALEADEDSNFKSVLQTIAQRDLGQTPHYQLLRDRGGDPARQYEVAAVLGGRRFPAATAATKKEAEQLAAQIALRTIQQEKGGHVRSERRRRSRRGGRR